MTEQEYVYQLRFTDARTTPGDWEFSDGMTIGYFSTEARAREALRVAGNLPGFRDDIDGFSIIRRRIGAIEFDRGFDPRDDLAVIDNWLSEN
ncbi:hypothetical protein [Leifsonia sp. Leaf336]|uniref:hypothetical protein n=1 Tax=Leifsonia sp. Leaf336 TaxID=1736341 RepID=UPI0012FC9BD0|nr:hypothetical protein [Leifsonia sp. Leaf336]